MALTKEQILTYLQLSKLGRVTAFALGDYAKENDIQLYGRKDLYQFIKEARAKKLARSIGEYTIEEIEQAENVALRIIERSELEHIKVISYYDNDFPKQLKNIQKNGKKSSPIILHYKGNIKRLCGPDGIAIIGTREPTEEGIKAGEYFGEFFAQKGFNIISGLAIGCDSSAHRGAINAQGLTTAFLAHGLNTIYPKESAKLADEILENDGLLISEYAIGTPPMINYFVERDRLQSGLADATIVIQTGVKGGTMHAVKATIENNKPLFAVLYKNETLCKHEKVLGNMKLLEENAAFPISANTAEEAINIIQKEAQKRDNFTFELDFNS